MIELDAEQVFAQLGAMLARAANPAPFLTWVGETETEKARQRIDDTKTSPQGVPWDPWEPSTEKQRVRKGNAQLGLLYDEGDLFDSIHFVVDGGTVAIGSDLDYALYLQDGTEKMDARPFLGWSDDAMPFYEGAFIDYLGSNFL